jgi:cell division septation protein DedD
MKNREYRELQVSSTQLAVIFLGILIIGVVIFLLGVSVGKKHAQLAQKANLIAEKPPEQVQEKTAIPEVKSEAKAEPKTAQPAPAQVNQPQKEGFSKKPQEGAPAQDKPELKKKSPPPTPQKPEAGNLYYVQVGALAERPAALSVAQRFKAQGYAVVVLDPLPGDRKLLYRVRIGGFKTRTEAEAARAKLAAATSRKTDYFIVRD